MTEQQELSDFEIRYQLENLRKRVTQLSLTMFLIEAAILIYILFLR